MAVRISHELERLVPQLRYEPTDKRISARLGSSLILDSRRAVLLWEPGRYLPVYAVPGDDVVARLEPPGADDPAPLPPADPPSSPYPFSPHTADGEPLTVVVSATGGGAGSEADASRVTGAAFQLTDPDLAGYVTFDTDAFVWFEEDERVIGHPRDPFSRIDMRVTGVHLRVVLDGVVLAESSETVRLFEGRLPPRTYFRPEDVHWDHLAPDSLHTICPYKGVASYWTAPGLGDGRPVAWTYGPDFPEMAQIHGRIAFFDERTDTEMEGAAVPRPKTTWA